MTKPLPISQLRSYRSAVKSMEYRRLKTAGERANYLSVKFGIPRWFIIAKKICTESQWKRMRGAIKQGRQIGIRGRPPKLSKERKQTIIGKALDRSKQGSPMTVRDFNATVYILLHFSCVFFFFYRLIMIISRSPSLQRYVSPLTERMHIT